MSRATWTLLAAALLLGGAAPAAAQDAGWWPWAGGGWEQGDDRYDDDRYEDDRWDDRYDRDDDRYDRDRRSKKAGKGPPFCRNGRGHPVHGWRWCEEKGWGRDGRAYDRGRYERDDRYDRDDRWGRVSWEDVILRSPVPSRRRLEQPTLADILGDVVFGRLTAHAGSVGARGPLDGRVLDLGAGGSVLQLRAGGVPLAELTDADRDGQVDLVLLRRD